MHKTATTTLAHALRKLGYQVTGPFGVNEPNIAVTAVDRGLALARRFDAVQDNPWPLLYRDLDQEFPGSKFILTLRPTDEWLSSVVKHFGGKTTPMREWIYGVGDPEGNEEVFRVRYERHNQEVRNYFSDRPGDLLEFRITDGDGWAELCSFLGLDQPSQPFPHANDHLNRRWDKRIQRSFRRLFNP